MKALKIVAVVLGSVLLLTGLGLLAGSALAGYGQRTFEREMTSQDMGGPVRATITAVDGAEYTVTYVDPQGRTQTATGASVVGETTLKVGDVVNAYYSTADPSIVVIVDLPGGDLSAIVTGLRVGGAICLVAGVGLLAAGVIALVRGRSQPVSAAPYPPQVPPGPPPTGYGPPGQPPYPPQYPNQNPPHQSPQYPYPPQNQPPDQPPR